MVTVVNVGGVVVVVEAVVVSLHLMFVLSMLMIRLGDHLVFLRVIEGI